MKKFLLGFLGSLAAMWLTIVLIAGGFIVFLASLIVSAGSQTVSVEKHSILYIDLNNSISEYRRSSDLMSRIRGGNEPADVLTDIIDAIDRAKDDDRIDGIFIDCNGASAGLAQRKAIIDAIKRFKESGKWVYSYGDTYTQGDYFVAVATADSIYVNPCGVIDIHGLSATTIFYKGLLDKLGISMQVVKVGTYKSAVEPFIMTAPSAASVEQQKLFLDNIWEEIAGEIAASRGVSTDSVNAWANNYVQTLDAKSYISRRIADVIAYRHEFTDMLEQLTGEDELRTITPAQYLAANPETNRSKTKIAVIYAEGDITENGDGGIASERIVPLIFDLAENDDIDGVILRVNSGGGSAYASEQIWEAFEQFKAMTGKPFYVSMSDMAASGGYYISCGADRIYAESLTLTGSIGIFGLLPNAHGLLSDHLGLTTSTVATNPSGEMPTIFEPLSDSQRAALQTYVERGYELFVKRVADGRKMTVGQVKAVAEGRVWDGREALNRKLVDKLGGLEMALADMAKELGHDNYRIVRYPNVKTNLLNTLLDMSDNMETKAIEQALGTDIRLFRAIKALRSMSLLQARMETIEIN